MPHTGITQDLSYLFQLEFFGEDGERLHSVPLDRAHFDRALGAACLDGVRRGVFLDFDPGAMEVRFVPRFAAEVGSAQSDGFSAVAADAGGAEHRMDFPTSFFRYLARRVRSQLVLDRGLPEKTVLRYALCAFPVDPAAPVAPDYGGALLLEPASSCLRLEAGRPGQSRARSGWDSPGDDDLPVLMPRWILEETVLEARAAPEKEIGGLLLGHLRRESEGSAAFLEVTCRVPAEDAVASGVSLTFSEPCFRRAREIAELRGQGEVCVGWHHSHPFDFEACRSCSVPLPPACIAKFLSFSFADEFLMETAFPQPYMVGLLVGISRPLEASLGHLPVRLYGWRNGELEPRGFQVVE